VAYLSVEDKARVWNTLDDNLRQKIRSGELTIEEAAELAIPMGDRELADARATAPAFSLDQPAPPVQPQEEYGVGTALETGVRRLGQAVDTAQLGLGLSAARRAQRALQEQQGTSTLGEEVAENLAQNPLGSGVEIAMAAGEGVGSWLVNKLNAAFFDAEQLQAISGKGIEFSEAQIAELQKTRDELAKLPPNPYSQAFVQAVDNGDFWTALKNLPGHIFYTNVEQTPTMLAQLGIVGAAGLTRSPTAVRGASHLAGAMGGASEIGSDFDYLLSQMSEEDRNDPDKLWEAWQLALQATKARTLIETVVPGRGLGKALPTRVATLAAGQMASEAGGEVLASEILGRDYTAGEIVAEAVAAGPQVVSESLGVIQDHRNQTILEARERARRLEELRNAEARRFAEEQRALEQQRIAEENRAAFDAEVEAEKAYQAARLNEGDQMEFAFGAEQGEREATIQDMFSGEEVSAEVAEGRRSGELQNTEVLEAQEQQRALSEERAANQIAERRLNELEAQRREEENARRQEVEDQQTLKNERQLLSTASITREAKRLVDIEKEGLRRTRGGIMRTQEQMDRMLSAYERKRLPELVDIVRNRRLDQVNSAREREIQRENERLEQNTPKSDERLDRARESFNRSPRTFTGQPVAISPGVRPELLGRAPLTDLLPENQQGAQERVTSEGELVEGSPENQQGASERAPSDGFPAEVPAEAQGDLFANAETQPQAELPLGPGETTGYTGFLTEEDRQRELAAGLERREQLSARRRREQEQEQERAQREAEQRALEAAIEQEIPTVEKALAEQERKAKTLTEKTYQKAEKKALTEAIAAENSVPNDTRTREEKVRAIAERMRQWRETNPPPATVQPTTANRAITQPEQDIQRRTTPEEATEIAGDRVLSREEDAALREELGGGQPKVDEATLVKETPEGIKYTEDSTLREALDNEFTKARPSLANVLRAIASHPEASAVERWLALKLAPIMDNTGIKLRHLDDPAPGTKSTAAGAYWAGDHSVWIRQATIRTILHEALHAATSVLIDSPLANTNPIVKQAKAQLDHALSILRTHVALDPSTLPADISMQKWEYVVSNAKELLAHVLTEKPLQEFLATIPAPGKPRNVWTVIKNAIKSLFRPKTAEQNSVLDMVIEATGDLVDTSSIDPALHAQARTSVKRMYQRRAPESSVVETAVEENARSFSNPRTQRALKSMGLSGRLIKYRPEWISNPIGTLLDALTSGGVTSRATTEALERAQSESAALINRAENLYRVIDSRLHKKANEYGEDPAEFTGEFYRAIESYEKAAPGQKLSIARGMRRRYGDAAKAYLKMRSTIDKLSKDILRQRLADPRPFTAEEARVYRSIKENLGTYYSRVYAAHTQGANKKYVHRMFKEYNTIVKGVKDPYAIDGYRKVKDAIIFVRENLLTIPSAEEMLEMPLAKLQKLADAWGVGIEAPADIENPLDAQARREYLIEGLLRFENADDKAKDMRALVLLEQMAYGEEGPLINYFRGAKQDRTIVTERTGIPKELRAFLGEVEDLPVRALVTIARQAEFRARSKLFNELLATEQGKRILSNEEFVERGMSPQDWTRLSGISYGALNGMWVRNDLARKLEDSAEVQRTFEQALGMADTRPTEVVKWLGGQVLKGWQKVASVYKAAQLVFNVGHAFLNFGGGGVILLLNGNLNIKHVRNAFNIARELVQAQLRGSISNIGEEVIRAGITDSAFMNEIRAAEIEEVRLATLEAMRSPAERVGVGIKRSGQGIRRWWKESYAMADVVWKIANYLNEKERLKKYYDLNGEKVTDEQIEREAAWRTNLTNFSYKRVPNLIRAIEKGGITYVMPYMYETFRAPVASFLLGAQDVARSKKAATPEAANYLMRQGIRRGIGALMSMGIAQQMAFTAARLIAHAFGSSDEEKDDWIDRAKALLPEFKQQSDYLYMGKRNGKPVLFEFSRLDPMGPSVEFSRKIMQAETADDVLEAFKDIIVTNPYGSSLISAITGTGSTNTRLQDITPEGYAAIVNAVGERGAKLIDSSLPSWPVRALNPENPTPDRGTTTDATWAMANLLKAMGIQHYEIDPLKTAQFKVSEYKAARAEISNDLRTVLRTQRGITEQELAAQIVELMQREQEAFEKLSNTYEAMLDVGYTPQQAMAMFSTKELDHKTMAMLAVGTYTPALSGVVNSQSIQQSLTEVMEESIPIERKRTYVENVIKLVKLAQGTEE